VEEPVAAVPCAAPGCAPAPVGLAPVAAVPAPVAVTPVAAAYPAESVHPAEVVGLTLQPTSIVAPVGSEVIVVASVRVAAGWTVTNERVEWALAPGSVGAITDVGRNGISDWIFEFNFVRGKVDNAFAIGTTLRSDERLNRGTPNPDDDVMVRSGQCWLSLTSPVEGTSYVTALVPKIQDWGHRKQSATVHWLDARWQFPSPVVVPLGSRHLLNTLVVRHSDCRPALGYRVRYQLLDGPPAGFAPGNAASIEVEVDATGHAPAEIMQPQPAAGTSRVNVQILRPAAPCAASPVAMVVACATTTVTWGEAATVIAPVPQSPAVVVPTLPGPSAPPPISGAPPLTPAPRPATPTPATPTTPAAAGITITIKGPETATVGNDVGYAISVSNRGTTTVPGLKIFDQYDLGLEFTPAPGQVQPRNRIESSLGTLSPGQTQVVNVIFRVTRAGRLCHTVEISDAQGKLLASEKACVTATAAAAPPEKSEPKPPAGPQVSLQVRGPAVGEASSKVSFDVTLTNTTTRPLSQLEVVCSADRTLTPTSASQDLTQQGDKYVWKIKELAAGKSQQLRVECVCEQISTRACFRAVANGPDAAGTMRTVAEGEACITIREAPKPAPKPAAATSALSIKTIGLRNPVRQGTEMTYEVRVTNDGTATEQGVILVARVPAQMLPVTLGTIGPTDATLEGQVFRFAPLLELLPGKTATYRIRVRAQQVGDVRFRAEATSRAQPTAQVSETATQIIAAAPGST